MTRRRAASPQRTPARAGRRVRRRVRWLSPHPHLAPRPRCPSRPSSRRRRSHPARIRFGQVVRIESRGTDGGREVVAMHAREEIAVDDVVGVAVDDRLLVGLLRARLVRGDERRADIGEVGAHGLRGQDGSAPMRSSPRVPAAPRTTVGFPGRARTGLLMPAWPPAPAATAIRPSAPFSMALWANLLLMMSCSTTPPPAVHGLVHVLARAQGRDDDRHLVLGADLHVVLQPVVALVHDLVDGERCGGRFRMGAVPGREGFGDLCEPFVQQFGSRALSAGMEPTMPAWHCAITSFGLLMMNSGEPMTGSESFWKTGGRVRMGKSPVCRSGVSVDGSGCGSVSLRKRPARAPSRWPRLRRGVPLRLRAHQDVFRIEARPWPPWPAGRPHRPAPPRAAPGP